MLESFDVISFDNLGLEQLNLKCFISNQEWEEFYQGEHSMYINAVDNYYSPSSRSDKKFNWNEYKLNEFFKMLETQNIEKD